jgi:hypothetical protein
MFTGRIRTHSVVVVAGTGHLALRIDSALWRFVLRFYVIDVLGLHQTVLLLQLKIKVELGLAYFKRKQVKLGTLVPLRNYF